MLNHEPMMSLVSDPAIDTPALIYNIPVIEEKLSHIKAIQARNWFELSYSIKSASFGKMLQTIAPHVQGFSSSSWFETKWLRSLVGKEPSIHFTSPGLQEKELKLISGEADSISFNSWSQFQNLHASMDADCRALIRVNPKTNFALDERYDPCRQHSKLGVSLQELAYRLKQETGGKEKDSRHSRSQ